MPNWKKIAEQNRDRALIRGDQLQGETGADIGRYGELEDRYRSIGDDAYDFLNQTPGYTDEEAAGIAPDFGQYRTSDADLQGRYLTGDEQSAIAGDPRSRFQYYNPSTLTEMTQASGGDQRRATQQLQEGMYGAINEDALNVSDRYGLQLDESLGQEGEGLVSAFGDQKAGMEGAVDEGRLGLSGDFSGKYRMTPEQQQDIITGAGISAGLGHRVAADNLERQARAAGTDPMGVAAYRARMERNSASDAGDAMTQARIAANREAAGRERDIEGMRLGTEQDISGRRMRTAETLGQQQMAAVQDYGRARRSAASDYEGRRMAGAGNVAGMRQRAAQVGGMAGIETADRTGRQMRDTEAYNQGRGQELEAGAEATQSQRAGYLGANRQNAAGNIQDTRFAQGMGAAGATSQGRQRVADARRVGQGEYRARAGQQQQMGQQGRMGTRSQQIGAYGTQYGAANQATGIGVQANAQPGWFDKIVNAGAQAASAAAGGMEHGGIATKPTMTTLGENGPEAILPLGEEFTQGENLAGMGDPDTERSAMMGMPKPPGFAGRFARAYGSQPSSSNTYSNLGRLAGSAMRAGLPMYGGSVVTEPTQAVIGENGPEAVIPMREHMANKTRPGMVTARRQRAYA